VLRLQQDIKQQVDQKMTNQKRTYFLQEQLKSIKKELGLEKDDKEAILNKFRDRRQKIKVRFEYRVTRKRLAFMSPPLFFYFCLIIPVI